MNRIFWKDKKVLVTGHTGFKGSWLALWLQKLGADVIGYALSPPTEPSLFQLAKVSSGMTSIRGDVRNLGLLRKVVSEHRPDILIHMAAQSLVRRSYADPVETYATNVMGTVNVLEAVRHSESVHAVVVVTSDKCYDNSAEDHSHSENGSMGGHDPYSSSKGCAELVTSAYRNSFFSPVEYPNHNVAIASARAGNVLGGGDWSKDRLVPDIVKAFSDCRPVVIRSPKAVRPWQFVLEPLSGYLSLAERLWTNGPVFAQAWNFGPDDEARPVSWIATRLSDLWGGGAGWELDMSENPREDAYLNVDSSKARFLLGWSAKTSLSMALEWTVEWHKGYLENKDARQLVEFQISNYENL